MISSFFIFSDKCVFYVDLVTMPGDLEWMAHKGFIDLHGKLFFLFILCLSSYITSEAKSLAH